jgi:hypothetical protein
VYSFYCKDCIYGVAVVNVVPEQLSAETPATAGAAGESFLQETKVIALKAITAKQ